ncbi:MAG: thioredoxin-like domain-containing protein, partial [Leeuwenhoekiella sp.]
SSTDAKNIRDLYISNKNLEAGKKLPEEILLDDELNRKSLLGLINRPTILYFWSSENRDHMIRSHAKAEKLRQLYPQYTILDINLDIDKDRWLQTLKEQNFDDRFSYKFVDKIEELRRDFSINNILKTIILNEDAIILNAHANMFSSQFESEILGYLNNKDL